MIIDCISDLHGFYPELDGGDLLIVAGDLTASDEFLQYEAFFKWLLMQKYKRKILIAGNHDGMLMGLYKIEGEETDLSYLCDSGTEFEGLKIWGSPWTHLFPGVNPRCTAFMIPKEQLEAKWKLIPDDIDILVTHSPPYGILDEYYDYDSGHTKYGGCEELYMTVQRIRPRLHVFGHIHENGGHGKEKERILYINASLCNEGYKFVNKPIRVIF
jgi:Icc-related predicted phosphoesterase